MEETQVVIVGAGPSGLALGVNLSKMGIDTIILERGCGVTEDPRGIAISGDAVRTSYQLGIGNALTTKIGQTIGDIHFHYGNFQTKPFGSFNHDRDWMEQSLPLVVLQFQPNFERELRKIIEDSPHCELREQCEVFESNDSCDGVIVGYKDPNGDEKHVRGEFLVGADGKTGVVRKKFLEPLGVKQEVGLFNYQETWVASNLQIIPPTPQSHPNFPLWKLGYTPDEVWHAFWPTGFHFCNDLARPSVSGPFGPKKERFWRHEYSVLKGDSVDDPLEDFLQNFQPWLIRPASHFKGDIPATEVAFPKDCVKIIRCRAFNFAHKVANRWFHNRTLLIGDAAHVFPPFGGQGIAAGLRDALALSWRLNLLLKRPTSSSADALLRGWQNEQRQRVDEAARATRRNARLVVERTWLRAWLARLVLRVVALVPGAHHWVNGRRLRDQAVLQECAEGFFVAARGGGAHVGQIWVRPYCGGPLLSDEVFFRRAGSLAVVVLLDGRRELEEEVEEVEGLLERAAVGEELLSLAAVTFLMRTGRRRLAVERKDAERYNVYLPCSGEELVRAGIEPIGGYDERSFEKRLGSKAKYVIVRPDCFVHSVAVAGEDFLQNLSHVQETLSR